MRHASDGCLKNQGKGSKHRYHKIENGTHVDSYFDRYRKEPEPGYVRPIPPCYWAAFGDLEEWVERKNAPPGSTTVPHPTPEGNIEDANSCLISEEAEYTTPPTTTYTPDPLGGAEGATATGIGGRPGRLPLRWG